VGGSMGAISLCRGSKRNPLTESSLLSTHRGSRWNSFF
jgi:hypothetical protein